MTIITENFRKVIRMVVITKSLVILVENLVEILMVLVKWFQEF